MDRKNRQTIRRSGAFLLAAGLSLTCFGVGTASADELMTDEPRTLADAGGVPNGGNGNAGQGGGQGGGQDNGNANAGGNGGGNPNGNNGSVKVHGSQGDESTHNEPKVDCLNLTWYDYSGAATANVVVTMVGGTDGQVVGEASTQLVPDAADGGGFDGELAVPLDFSGIEPANNGMYHVRVDVRTDDHATGDSESKSKVVWVSGTCGGGTTTTPPDGCVPSSTVTCGGLFDLDPVVTAAPIVETPVAAPATEQTDVLGNQEVAAPAPAPAAAAPAGAPAAEVKGAELARTGALTDRLVQVAGALLVLGGIAMVASKERAVAVPTRRR